MLAFTIGVRGCLTELAARAAAERGTKQLLSTNTFTDRGICQRSTRSIGTYQRHIITLDGGGSRRPPRRRACSAGPGLRKRSGPNAAHSKTWIPETMSGAKH
jgi:hypothetical protein